MKKLINYNYINHKVLSWILILLLSSNIWGCSYISEDDLLGYAESYLTEQSIEEASGAEENSVVKGVLDDSYSDDFDYASIPSYDGTPYVTVNDNVPYFTNEELDTDSYEYYGALDALGRCTVVMACLSQDTMPADEEERGSISSVLPTGWESISYDCIVSNSLYNRSHLIGWQLSAENDNENNLITGTRYMNIEMLDYENLVANYIEETGNHVMYRVTPVFEGDDLLCKGILMEGYSVEDEGEGIFYNVFFYNVQPGITLDYSTGSSTYSGVFLDMDASTVNYEAVGLESETSAVISSMDSVDVDDASVTDYVLNTSTMKIHLPECSSVEDMSDSNKEEVTTSMEALLAAGYEPCGNCNP